LNRKLIGVELLGSLPVPVGGGQDFIAVWRVARCALRCVEVATGQLASSAALASGRAFEASALFVPMTGC
jgi:hypothetical protein